jgi:mRNA interferase RelE/StbE
MFKLKISDQVIAFVRKQAPERRKTLRTGLDALAKGKGDILPLEENLAGFWRLRIGRFRIVFDYEDSTTIRCLFIEERRLVYEVFASMLKEHL